MRAVRVLGLADSGREVVCEDPTTGERFLVARDERLRAAARGDADRLDTVPLPEDSQLSPREIQTRIRAGASVEDIAAIAGTSLRRIERFAYPVLLERSTVADKARTARPTIDGIASNAPIEEVVTASLGARGQHDDVSWDAFREDDTWILRLSWQVGRSENRAHWTFHPGPAGGTLTARDENAADIVDPALRVLHPLREIPAAAVRATVADPATGDAATGPAVGTVVPQVEPAPAAIVAVTITETITETLVEQPPARTGTEDASAVRPTPRTMPARGKGKSARPVMPSWEDVLLGTRSTR